MTPARTGVVAVIATLTAVLAGCVPAPPASMGRPTARAAADLAAVPTPSTTTAGGRDPGAAIADEARAWALRVRSTACLETGSGFVLGASVVTNRHVAVGSSAMQLSTWDGTDLSATVTAISAGPDLALLRPAPLPAGTRGPPVAAADPPPGTPVWVAGYPEGDQLTVTAGSVADYVDGSLLGEAGQVMEVTDSVEPGSSGSAVLDAAGEVVGVAFALRTGNGDGLVIPVSELQSFVTSPGVRTTGDCAA